MAFQRRGSVVRSNQARQWDVISLGDIFTDLVMTGFTRWPMPGEEVVAEALAREVGGGAAITACGLAHLGSRVALMTTVGADGEWLHRRVSDLGVDTSLLKTVADVPTGITVAISTDADRTFFTYPGANSALPLLLADAGTVESLALARHIHLASAVEPELLVALAQRLRPTGTTISLDVGWVESWLRNRQSLAALREVDLFLPNEREASALTGETNPEQMLHSLAAAGVPLVALKLGAAGAITLADGEIIRSRPVSVLPVDTTGAGDSFDAGFIAAWLAGEPLATCLQLGNRCGALSTTVPGGLAWIESQSAGTN